MHPFQPLNQPSLRPLFDVPQLGFVVDAMQAGNSPATMWVDDPATPRSALLWDTTHSLYLGGAADNTLFNHALRDFLVSNLIPEGRARQLEVFKVYTSSDAWAARIPALFGAENMPVYPRSLFRLQPGEVDLQPVTAPAGFQVRPIEPDLLDAAAHPNAERLREEIESCWTSIERFWQFGYGYSVVTDAGEIATWCTAEYVSGNTCGIGIETVEAYQGKGLATLAARAFLRHGLAEGRTIHWDCWINNLPSVKTAQKAGFRPVGEYTIQIGVLDSDPNE